MLKDGLVLHHHVVQHPANFLLIPFLKMPIIRIIRPLLPLEIHPNLKDSLPSLHQTSPPNRDIRNMPDHKQYSQK